MTNAETAQTLPINLQPIASLKLKLQLKLTFTFTFTFTNNPYLPRRFAAAALTPQK